MAETTTVSVSRSPVSETARHLAKFRESGETVAETSPLKALARRVLDRDTRRDTSRDSGVSVLPIADAPIETPVSAVSPVSGVSSVSGVSPLDERALSRSARPQYEINEINEMAPPSQQKSPL